MLESIRHSGVFENLDRVSNIKYIDQPIRRGPAATEESGTGVRWLCQRGGPDCNPSSKAALQTNESNAEGYGNPANPAA